jgi:hypothetical protein
MTATIDGMTYPISMIAAADLTTKFRRFGKLTATGVNVCTVAGEAAAGVIGAHYKKNPAAGDAVDFYVDRQFCVETGGAFAANVDLTTDADGRAVAATGGSVVNAVALEASTAAGDIVKIKPPYSRSAALTTIANASISPASTRLNGVGLIVIDIPNAATATYTYVNAEKIEIVAVWNIKDTAGAGNTIQINNASDVAITNAMAAAVDKTKTDASTIDKATRTLEANAGFKVVATRAAGSMAAQLFILAIPRA